MEAKLEKYRKSSGKLSVSGSPHTSDKASVRGIMLDVIIAMIPAMVASLIFFGINSLILIITSVAACVLAELICQKMLKRPVTVSDLSAAVTGILIAFNVPVTMPIWQVVLGGFFAIVIVKQLFGGLGSNFMNPALAARAMMMASWSDSISSFTKPMSDAVSSATYLSGQKFGMLDMFLGNIPGTIGEVSKLALLLGLFYLLFRRVISWEIPLTYFLSTAVLLTLFGTFKNGFDPSLKDLPYQMLAGGLFLGAIFMATDYATSPVSKKGKFIFALGCGFLTALFRVYGGYPEGVSYAILLMNVATPLIDKFTKPVQFGGAKNEAK